MVIGFRRSTVSGALALGVMAILVAACSSSSGAAGPAANAATASASLPGATTAAAPAASAGGAYGAGAYGGSDYGKAAVTPAPAPAAGASVYEVKTASGSVGTYLTGEDGKTLYVFKKDPPNASVCVGGCATNWPPFTLDPGESAKAGAGVTGSITTFTRTDGKTQVAYNGAPVYYFAADTKAGDTNGQGINSVWFVAQP